MTDQEKSFIESCFEGDIKSIKTCIKYGVDIHVESDWCIDIAARKENSKLVKFFIENGISHESASKKLVLAYAAAAQDKDLVKYLLSQSDEYKKDDTALTWVAMNGNLEIAEMLLAYLDSFDGVFCRAAEAGRIPFLEFLIDNSIQDLDSGAERSPYWAACKNKWSTVEMLLNNNIGDIESLGEKYKEMYLNWKNNNSANSSKFVQS